MTRLLDEAWKVLGQGQHVVCRRTASVQDQGSIPGTPKGHEHVGWSLHMTNVRGVRAPTRQVQRSSDAWFEREIAANPCECRLEAAFEPE
nr:hypothetical protein CFP56_75115 [Quercus suber]